MESWEPSQHSLIDTDMFCVRARIVVFPLLHFVHFVGQFLSVSQTMSFVFSKLLVLDTDVDMLLLLHLYNIIIACTLLNSIYLKSQLIR